MASLRTLRPELVDAATWLYRLGRTVDRQLRVTSARRSFAEQSRLFDKFRRGESKLPALPAGKSLHQVGRAFDLARPSVDPYQDELLVELGKVWVSLGGRWSATDPVHFEA